MRSLEMHLFEEETDIDLALKSGILLPEQLAHTVCTECDADIGFNAVEFECFIVVIDENDQDWALCEECCSPMMDYVDTYFPPVTKSHFAAPVDSDDLDYF